MEDAVKFVADHVANLTVNEVERLSYREIIKLRDILDEAHKGTPPFAGALKIILDDRNAKGREFARQALIDELSKRPVFKESIVHNGPEAGGTVVTWSLSVIRPGAVDTKVFKELLKEARERGRQDVFTSMRKQGIEVCIGAVKDLLKPLS